MKRYTVDIEETIYVRVIVLAKTAAQARRDALYKWEREGPSACRILPQVIQRQVTADQGETIEEK